MSKSKKLKIGTYSGPGAEGDDVISVKFGRRSMSFDSSCKEIIIVLDDETEIPLLVDYDGDAGGWSFTLKLPPGADVLHVEDEEEDDEDDEDDDEDDEDDDEDEDDFDFEDDEDE